MKKLFMIIITMCVCLVFSACNNQDSNILLDNNKSITDNDKETATEEDEAIYDAEDNFKDKEDEDSDMMNGNIDSIVSESEFPVDYYIYGNGVRMRENASLESYILIQLGNGTRVEYVDRKGEWIKVKYDDKIGYIRNDLLIETEPIDDIMEETVSVLDNFTEEVENSKIVVKKADRILQLWDGDNLKASYNIGLGWEPVGDKEKEGDGKTPEGIYYVCTRNNYSRFYLSLGLSYPNIEDASDALDVGLIDQGTYNQIEDAINREVQPPWNTALGGEIMIHGHGSHSDWTAGCIAVENDIMDILWANCQLGTAVIIEP